MMSLSYTHSREISVPNGIWENIRFRPIIVLKLPMTYTEQFQINRSNIPSDWTRTCLDSRIPNDSISIVYETPLCVTIVMFVSLQNVIHHGKTEQCVIMFIIWSFLGIIVTSDSWVCCAWRGRYVIGWRWKFYGKGHSATSYASIGQASDQCVSPRKISAPH